jgi:hypothetical protein
MGVKLGKALQTVNIIALKGFVLYLAAAKRPA